MLLCVSGYVQAMDAWLLESSVCLTCVKNGGACGWSKTGGTLSSQRKFEFLLVVLPVRKKAAKPAKFILFCCLVFLVTLVVAFARIEGKSRRKKLEKKKEILLRLERFYFFVLLLNITCF